MNPYLRFAAMIATSTIVMFGLMYLNTYQVGHVSFSETRVYMAFIMGAAMAVIMLTFMLNMHKKRGANIGIYIASAAVFALSLWLVRSQATVEDVSYMRAMIPHHSIAILTSERANISDARVRRLADEIIAAQRREITEMKVLIDDIEKNGTQTTPGRETATQKILGPQVPPPDASEALVADGFRAEVVVSGLTYPTSVEFDDAGAMYVAEAGYSYGDEQAVPRILQFSPDGDFDTLLQGRPLIGPVNDLLWHDGQLFISHRGKISIFESGGKLRDLVSGLPSDGDHHNNQMTVGPDGKIYFGQGTLTNSGVVGIDNFKMGWLKQHPNFHDIPARDITLIGRTYETPNPLDTKGNQVETSAFHQFAKSDAQGSVVHGQTKASGTILRMSPDGSEIEVYAWGLRNPFGVMWSPDGTLYATENGCDVRGSRPIANDQEDIYVIKEAAWYGWPDYAMGLPVTDPRFKPKDKPQPQFVMAEHPSVEQPWLNFPKHAAISKLDFSNSEPFGDGHMFVAFFGHMSPMTGEAPEEHGGHRVVRIDPASKTVETFFSKKHEHHGQSQEQGHGEEAQGQQHENAGGNTLNDGHKQDESMTAGPRRLLDVRFEPDGKALYIADFGVMEVEDKPRPVPETGVIWRIVAEGEPSPSPPAGLSVAK